MKLSWLLPGLLTAATGLGAADVFTASLGGYHIGEKILWASFLGAFFKWSLNEGLIRFQLATGHSLVEGWKQNLPKVFAYFFLIYFLIWTFTVSGTLARACGEAFVKFFSWGDPKIAALVHGLAGGGLVLIGGYKLFEKIMTVCVGVMFFVVLALGITCLPELGNLWQTGSQHEFSWTLGVLGAVGGTVTILNYGYWVQEKKRKGLEGLKICQKDLALAYIMTGLFSASMVLVGARLSQGNYSKLNILEGLLSWVEASYGPVATFIFSIGIWCTVASSLLGVWQGVPYIFADYVLPGTKKENLQHSKAYYFYLGLIMLSPLATLFLSFQGVVKIYSVFGAIFMPFVALSLLFLNNQKKVVSSSFKNALSQNLFLGFTLAFFLFLGFKKLFT